MNKSRGDANKAIKKYRRIHENELYCHRCGVARNIQIHHIFPVMYGGDDSEENLVPLCATCHDEVDTWYSFISEDEPGKEKFFSEYEQFMETAPLKLIYMMLDLFRKNDFADKTTINEFFEGIKEIKHQFIRDSKKKLKGEV